MANPNLHHFQNQLLATMNPTDRALLKRHLELVELEHDTLLVNAQKPIQYAHFLESGIAARIFGGVIGRPIETNLIGCEGMTGTTLLLGSDRSPHDTVMQTSGHGYRVAATTLLKLIQVSPSLHIYLLQFVHVLSTQTAYTALSNASNSVEERLARWILMYADRSPNDEVRITHRKLSEVLGISRPSVTLALQSLEGQQLLRCQRGRVTLCDRAKLSVFAAVATYGHTEREYARLLGQGRRPSLSSRIRTVLQRPSGRAHI